MATYVASLTRLPVLETLWYTEWISPPKKLGFAKDRKLKVKSKSLVWQHALLGYYAQITPSPSLLELRNKKKTCAMYNMYKHTDSFLHFSIGFVGYIFICCVSLGNISVS